MFLAYSINVQPSEFWDMTPAELGIMIRAFNEKTKADHKNELTLAYLTAYWHRVKKMPKLKEVLNEEEPKKKKMTAQDMLNEIKRLNEAMGGTVY